MDALNRFIIPLKNRVRYSRFLRGFVTRFLVNTDYPSVIGVDPTNRCNLKCSFCGPVKMKTPKGAMEWELYRKLVRECADHKKLWMLILHNFGEPLLNENIARMVELAKREKISRSVQFATNGTLLDEAAAAALIRSGLDGLVLSVDAFTRQEYRSIKGLDLLDRVVENAKMLARMKRALESRTPFVTAKMIRRKGLEDSYGPFLSMWKSIADEAALTAFTNWGDMVPNEGCRSVPLKRYACHFLWYYPVVNWDGKVFFCCTACDEAAVIGDLKTSSLAMIWKGERLRKIREAHLAGEYRGLRPCERCTYWAESGVNLDRYLAKKTA